MEKIGTTKRKRCASDASPEAPQGNEAGDADVLTGDCQAETAQDELVAELDAEASETPQDEKQEMGESIPDDSSNPKASPSEAPLVEKNQAEGERITEDTPTNSQAAGQAPTLDNPEAVDQREASQPSLELLNKLGEDVDVIIKKTLYLDTMVVVLHEFLQQIPSNAPGYERYEELMEELSELSLSTLAHHMAHAELIGIVRPALRRT